MRVPATRPVLAGMVVTGLVAAISIPALAKPVTITWFVRSDVEENQWERKVVADFQKLHKDIRVKLVVVPWDQFETKLQTLFASGNPPDIWSHWGQGGFMDYKSRNLVLDLTPYIQRDKFDMNVFFPGTADQYKINGRYYGLPLLALGSYTFYNRTLFKEAGLPDLPVDWNDTTFTWDQMVEYAKKLTRDVNNDGRIDQYGINLGWWPPMVLPWQFGGDWWAPDAYKTGIVTKATIDSPQNRKAYQAAVDLIFKYRVHPTRAEASAMTQAGDIFKTGKIGMNPTGGWGFWTYADIKNFEWGVGILPKGSTRKPPLFVDPWMIARTSKHPDAAWEFLKFLMGKEQYASYVRMVGPIPARKDAMPIFLEKYARVLPANKLQTLIAGSFRVGQESPNHTLVGYSELENRVNAQLDNMWLGKEKVEQALPKAQAELEKLIRERAARAGKPASPSAAKKK